MMSSRRLQAALLLAALALAVCAEDIQQQRTLLAAGELQIHLKSTLESGCMLWALQNLPETITLSAASGSCPG
jgi:hypothetical protein